jgi:NAD(P)-dependent dehydrogenase (short-subunit alcohol dehydrogenase family)
VITGASSGPGFGLSQRFAAAGADVVLAVRDLDDGEDTMYRIHNLVPRARQRVKQLDLSSLASIGALSKELAGEGRPVDFLINNAAIPAPTAHDRTEDGSERRLGTNYLGHFALTGQLLPLLRASAAGRVVTVVSLAPRIGRIDLAALRGEHYRPFRPSGLSKLAHLIFALELDRRSKLGGWGVRSNAAQGAADATAPALFAAVCDAAAGDYFGPGRFAGLTCAPSRAMVPRGARDVRAAWDLWRMSEDLTGVTYPAGRRLPGTGRPLTPVSEN